MIKSNHLKSILLLLILTACIPAAGQSDSTAAIGENLAREILKEALTDSTLHNVINRKDFLLKDKKKAVDFAEPILFDVYGAKEIKKQRPYEVHGIDNYWILSGTLPGGMSGGTFLMIMDARDCRVVRLTHGK
jgi:hypothetical protein